VKRSPLSPGAKALSRGSTFKPRDPSKALGSSKPGRRPSFAASTAQRAKVKGQVCAVTECFAEHCDPAHLAPRALGRGCDSPLCVIALCRFHHEQFDRGDLDLCPHLSCRGFGAELAHMQGHYEDPLSVLIRLSGTYWVPDTDRSAA
jgi:hypothetical protein